MLKNAISESRVKNHLHLFKENGDVDVTATIKFLDISRSELAQTFGLTVDQLRPERISSKVREKISEIAGALELVAETFSGDQNKTRFWIRTPNPNFGGASPRSMIVRGRYHKVLTFILAARRQTKVA